MAKLLSANINCTLFNKLCDATSPRQGFAASARPNLELNFQGQEIVVVYNEETEPDDVELNVHLTVMDGEENRSLRFVIADKDTKTFSDITLTHDQIEELVKEEPSKFLSKMMPNKPLMPVIEALAKGGIRIDGDHQPVDDLDSWLFSVFYISFVDGLLPNMVAKSTPELAFKLN